jgi:putative FmdB family regulatory protein
VSKYNYICNKCGEIILERKFGTAKDTEICPECGQEVKRCYSPVLDLWKTSGSYNQTR